MTIKDRGKIKWAAAAFIPEGFALTRKMFMDQEREPMPIIDEYEKEEFDLRICYAMEYNLPVKISVWDDGFIDEVIGRVHRRDELTRELRIELADGSFYCVKAGEMVGVEVND
ncbi:YolD-like family protein [Neobacillus mesonae]|uniref:YolD-like family protein n=1 Tax=Neobacillus mesonae TaxID=1193713 RepID=A0A3T0HVJ1_9BACI|nr:hypothetical protein CHR53_07415 [Neobacillus mesonae]